MTSLFFLHNTQHYLLLPQCTFWNDPRAVTQSFTNHQSRMHAFIGPICSGDLEKYSPNSTFQKESFGFALNLHGENWDQPFEYQRDDKSLTCKMCQVQPLDSDEKTAAAAEPHTTLPLCTL